MKSGLSGLQGKDGKVSSVSLTDGVIISFKVECFRSRYGIDRNWCLP